MRGAVEGDPCARPARPPASASAATGGTRGQWSCIAPAARRERPTLARQVSAHAVRDRAGQRRKICGTGCAGAIEARLAAEDRFLPEHVREDFETLLRCGVLEHDFLRVVCEHCHAECKTGVRVRFLPCKKKRTLTRGFAGVQSAPNVAVARPPPARQTHYPAHPKRDLNFQCK